MPTTITLTPEVVTLLERIVAETTVGSYSQPVSPDEARLGAHHNNAQRGFVTDTAYELAAAIRTEIGPEATAEITARLKEV